LNDANIAFSHLQQQKTSRLRLKMQEKHQERIQMTENASSMQNFLQENRKACRIERIRARMRYLLPLGVIDDFIKQITKIFP